MSKHFWQGWYGQSLQVLQVLLELEMDMIAIHSLIGKPLGMGMDAFHTIVEMEKLLLWCVVQFCMHITHKVDRSPNHSETQRMIATTVTESY